MLVLHCQKHREDHVWCFHHFDQEWELHSKAKDQIQSAFTFTLTFAKENFRKHNQIRYKFMMNFSGEYILGDFFFFWTTETFESCYYTSWGNKDLDNISISGIFCEIGLLEISASLILIVFCSFYMYCLIWKKTVKIKIIKSVLFNLSGDCSTVN